MVGIVLTILFLSLALILSVIISELILLKIKDLQKSHHKKGMVGMMTKDVTQSDTLKSKS